MTDNIIHGDTNTSDNALPCAQNPPDWRVLLYTLFLREEES
jgi:hypothetical protein